MGRHAKPAKVKAKATPPLARKAPTEGAARVHELEQRLAESLEREKAKDRALTEALEQQTATSEILRVISRSPMDYQPVFDTIVQHATRLCRGRFGTVYRFDGQLIHLAAHYNLTPEAVAALHEIYPTPNPTPNTRGLVGPAIREGRIVHVADVQAAYSGPSSRMASILGFHSQIVVPMLREDTCIGALSIAREERGLFPSGQVELLKTFADQAVIAIENVRLFREIEIKSRELEAASQHKSQFLANMSHELRTPLNAIIGVTDLLLEDARDLERTDEIEPLERVLRAGRHLLALINSILDLSKIEAGHMELELDDFHLSPAIDDALLLMRERAGRRRLALERHVDGRVGEIRGDQQKVKQVLLNLLSNAVKFTPEGGRIDVRAALVDGTVEISVTDTGIGIAPEDQEAVFEEFRQVGKAEKKAEGTGLGLALCRKFVELHGGRIWVKSQVGHGSTFTFTLPVRQGDRAVTPQ